MTQVRAEMEAGTDPSSEWVQAPSPGAGWGSSKSSPEADRGTERSVGNMWQEEVTIHGIDTGQMRETMAYVSRAVAASDEGRARNPSTSEATQVQRTARDRAPFAFLTPLACSRASRARRASVRSAP